MPYVDSHGCVIRVEPEAVESGPLRDSDLSEGERLNMPPNWAWLQHGPTAYETRSDLRALDGTIVPRGTKTLARRDERWLTLDCDDGRVVKLDGALWCVPISDVPLYRVA